MANPKENLFAVLLDTPAGRKWRCVNGDNLLSASGAAVKETKGALSLGALPVEAYSQFLAVARAMGARDAEIANGVLGRKRPEEPDDEYAGDQGIYHC
jgi:hypothetical protein